MHFAPLGGITSGVRSIAPITLTLTVVFLVAGILLAIAGVMAAREGQVARDDLLRVEAKAAELRVANPAIEARARSEHGQLGHAVVLFAVLGGASLVLLLLAFADRAVIPAAALVAGAAIATLVLAPKVSEEPAAVSAIDISTPRERALLPAGVCLIGAAIAVGSVLERRKQARAAT